MKESGLSGPYVMNGRKVNGYKFWAGKTVAMGRLGSLRRKLEDDVTISSLCSLSYDRSIATSKANSPLRAI
jgi:hypothetical protein